MHMDKCKKCLKKDKDKSITAGYCLKYYAQDGHIARCAPCWTEEKHKLINHYCDIFTRGMKNKFPQLNYIDLFAGPGKYIIRETGIEGSGSPLIAAGYKFHNIYLNDLDAKCTDALDMRLRQNGNSNFKIFNSDANFIAKDINSLLSLNSLSFCLADPNNMGDLKFSTLGDITNGRRVDLLINFHYGNDYRRWVNTVDGKKYDEAFGTDKWRKIEAKYNNKEISFRAKVIIDLFIEQLEIFGFIRPDKCGSFIHYKELRNSKNSLLYYLIFASKHQRGYDFWEKIWRSSNAEPELPLKYG